MEVPLTPLGEQQARSSAAELAQLGLQDAALLTSDLLRAQQTAALIGEVLGHPFTLDDRLREQHYGELQGRLTSELVAEPVPEGSHITEIAWGGGESIADVYARVRGLLVELRAAGRDAVLVTHGDTIRVALCAVDQLNQGEPDEFPHRLVAWPKILNGSIRVCELAG